LLLQVSDACFTLPALSSCCLNNCLPNCSTLSLRKVRLQLRGQLSYASVSCVHTGIDVPRFDGKGYIAFPPLVTSPALAVSVELRPESADGLLLYNADTQSRFKDFIAIELMRGYLELRFLSNIFSSRFANFDCVMAIGTILGRHLSRNSIFCYTLSMSCWTTTSTNKFSLYLLYFKEKSGCVRRMRVIAEKITRMRCIHHQKGYF